MSATRHWYASSYGTCPWIGECRTGFQDDRGQCEKIAFFWRYWSWEEAPTIHGMPKLPQHAIDRVLMESTRAGKNHMDTGIEIAKIVDFIRTHK